MTLPSTGAIATSDINIEVGNASNYSLALSWIRDNTKPSVTDFNSLRSKAYYQKNNDGNCANGNCTSNCNCGNIQCNNCVISGTVNCLNCDAQKWLQTDCNCGTPYNCTTGATSYNCNCDCPVDCACACNCPVDCACNCPVDCACDCPVDCACDCNCDCGG
jgi:hypothetical protein